MALGGGIFVAQNKILPGAYMNFVSVAKASANLSDRGIATLPLSLDWGPEQTVLRIEQGEFLKNSQTLLGHAYTDDALAPLREIFLHAKTVYLYRLNSGGEKASNTFAMAKHPGTRGNDLKVVIQANEASTDQKKLYDVALYLGTALVDEQKAVSKMADLKPNAFVEWVPGATITATAGTALVGGTDGAVSDAAYQGYLDRMEAYNFNAMGCLSADDKIKSLFVGWCKRMRDDVGKKFQVVLFRKLADYEGVVSVKNGLESDQSAASLVPWVTGVVAGTAVNQSATNLTYDGEYTPETASYSQKALEDGITEGSFCFHRVDESINVLEDINTFVSVTDEKSGDFSSNQTIRVLDQIANDIAVLFGKKYIGKVPNDASGRVSLWGDIVQHHTQLQAIRAIEDFSGDDVTVDPGEGKKAVVVTDYVKPINAMSQLYMTIYVE